MEVQLRMLNKQIRFGGLLILLLVTGACALPSPIQPQAQPSVTPIVTQGGGTPIPGGTTETATQPSGSSVQSETILQQTAPLSFSQNTKANLSVDGKSQQVLSIEVQNDTNLKYNVHLVDPFGNFIASLTADGTNASEKIAEIGLPYDGTYGVVVSPVQGDGQVNIIVSELSSPSGGGTLDAAGSTSIGQMGAPHVFHIYQITLAQGSSVTISARATATNTPDTSLAVYSPTGQFLAEADDASVPDNLDAVISNFSAPVDGVYTVVVTNKGNSTGTYDFAVIADDSGGASAPADIVYDSEYRAGLFEGSNLSVTFDATIGDVLKVELLSPESGITSDLYLYNPANQIVAFAVSGQKGVPVSISEVQAALTGRYRLEVRPIGSGQATFKVTRLQQSDLTGGGVFSDGQAVSLPGRISAPNTFHFYQFSAKAGDRILLAAFSVSQGGALDLGFAILGPGGNQIAFADDSTGEFPKDPELADFEIPQTGTYTVIVYSFTKAATGTYDLVLTRR